MTLIDIDPLKERIDKEVKEGKVLDGWAFFIKAYLDSEPYIDIVRCKECKYEPICSHSVQHTTHEPTSVTIGYKSVDYCSYGERKSDEQIHRRR